MESIKVHGDIKCHLCVVFHKLPLCFPDIDSTVFFPSFCGLNFHLSLFYRVIIKERSILRPCYNIMSWYEQCLRMMFSITIDITAYTNITEYVLKPGTLPIIPQTQMKFCCTFPACLHSIKSCGHVIL